MAAAQTKVKGNLSKKEKHIVNNTPVKAVLTRASTDVCYSRGHAHISGDAGRSAVYQDGKVIIKYLKFHDVKPRKSSVPAGSAAHAAQYMIGSGENFTRSGAPYYNEAHHLLPINFFYVDVFFDTDALEILKRIEYDVNDGDNFIFLPQSYGKCRHKNHGGDDSYYEFAEVHGLPNHRVMADHPGYNKLVVKLGNNMAKRLKKIIDEQRPCEDWDPPQDIADELKKHQDLCWKKIVAMGPKKAL